ncbi:MAG: AhpC/TSA family protein [Ardenticatenaceae bacterium]|nr:AhpC/TSA family protein [Ardenticatenaceae bacterium]
MNQQNKPESAPFVGNLAPQFTLPAVQGGQVSLADYVGRCRVILWFSRGFTCNFCRRYMQLIVDRYEDLTAHEIEVVQVNPNLLETSRLYFDPATPYPFVCDPDKRLYAVYGLGDRGVLEAQKNTLISFGTAFASGEGQETVKASWLDVMNRNFLQRLHHHALTAVEQGVFIIDKQGIIRYRQVYNPMAQIPTGEELLLMTQAVCGDG